MGATATRAALDVEDDDEGLTEPEDFEEHERQG